MKKLLLSITIILISTTALYAQNSSLTLTTYYPAPFGAYDRLRLVPRAALTGGCTAGTIYAETTGSNPDIETHLRFCVDNGSGTNGTWDTSTSPWTQNDNDVFLTDPTTPSDVLVGIGTSSPDYKLSIASPNDDTKQVGIYHDNANAYFGTTAGSFIFITDEGTDTPSIVLVSGRGTGTGVLQLADQDDAELLQLTSINGVGLVQVIGTSPGALLLQPSLPSTNVPIHMFAGAESGQTQELQIWGFEASDSLRSLQIGVGVDAADTASFDGVSNYYFDGNVGIGTTGPSAKLDVRGGDLWVYKNDIYLLDKNNGTADGMGLKYVGVSEMGIFSDNIISFRESDADATKVYFDLNNGLVGIGTTDPKSTLDVNGGIKVGADTAACNATKAGTIRYNAGAMQFCDGTDWQNM